MHGIGYVTDKGLDTQEVQRGAPKRFISFVNEPVALAYMVRYLVTTGQIPEPKGVTIIRRVLARTPQVDPDEVAAFRWTKMPYTLDVIEADLTGDVTPFIQLRYGGWECRDHRSAVPGDLPAKALERDLYSCIVCGDDEKLGVHHLVQDKKAKTTIGNLGTLCASCKVERGARSYWDYIISLGYPMNDLMVDFRSGFIRSFVVGGKVRL
jgi:hypothetical protein